MSDERQAFSSRVGGWASTTTLADLLSPRGAAVRLAAELVAAGACLALVVSLFLPWYEFAVALPATQTEGPVPLPRPDSSVSAWEAFRAADVILALLAAGGLAFLVAARVFRLPVLLAVTAAAGWGAFAVALYAHTRPAGLVAGSSPLAFGFFVALCSAGGMLLGSQLAFACSLVSEGPRRQ
jgi:hypothetical protein